MASGFTVIGLAFLAGRLRPDLHPAPSSLYLALVTAQNVKAINASAATDEGSGRVGIPVTSHGYATGDHVVIEGTTNYDGAYLVHATSTASKVVITTTYIAETFTGSSSIHKQPGPKTQVLSDLNQIAIGNGYPSGGLEITLDSTGVPTFSLTSTAPFRFYFRIQNTDFVADGGTLPASGLGARYAVLLDDNVVPADRVVIGYYDLVAARSVSDTQKIGVYGAELEYVWR